MSWSAGASSSMSATRSVSAISASRFVPARLRSSSGSSRRSCRWLPVNRRHRPERQQVALAERLADHRDRRARHAVEGRALVGERHLAQTRRRTRSASSTSGSTTSRAARSRRPARARTSSARRRGAPRGPTRRPAPTRAPAATSPRTSGSNERRACGAAAARRTGRRASRRGRRSSSARRLPRAPRPAMRTNSGMWPSGSYSGTPGLPQMSFGGRQSPR